VSTSIPPSVPARQTSGLAIASLILGLCGIILCLGPLTGIPAVICGHIAQSKIRSSGGVITGGGLAITGLITGYISLAWIVVIGLLAAIAVPNFVKARQTALKAVCRNNLRMIDGAKAAWQEEEKKPDGSMPTDMDLFGPQKSINSKPSCPAGGEYTLNPLGTRASCSIHDTAD
jgi:general secretion pathway protein G